MARILLIDDEQDVLFLLRSVLELDGHAISTAGNGAEALALLGVDPPQPEAELPDLIILDVMMPVMDGFSLSFRLAQDSRLGKTPVVFLTARGGMRHSFQPPANVAAFLEKPVESLRLRALVTRILAAPR